MGIVRGLNKLAHAMKSGVISKPLSKSQHQSKPQPQSELYDSKKLREFLALHYGIKEFEKEHGKFERLDIGSVAMFECARLIFEDMKNGKKPNKQATIKLYKKTNATIRACLNVAGFKRFLNLSPKEQEAKINSFFNNDAVVSNKADKAIKVVRQLYDKWLTKNQNSKNANAKSNADIDYETAKTSLKNFKGAKNGRQQKR